MWLAFHFPHSQNTFSSFVVENIFLFSPFFPYLFYSICTSRLKLKLPLVTVVSASMITVKPGKSKSTLNYQLQNLKETVPKVVIKVRILHTICTFLHYSHASSFAPYSFMQDMNFKHYGLHSFLHVLLLPSAETVDIYRISRGTGREQNVKATKL